MSEEQKNQYVKVHKLNGSAEIDPLKLPSVKETYSHNDSPETGLVPVTTRSRCDSKSILANIRTVIYAFIFGILFGFFMNKGTIYVAPTIRMQMLFRRFAMLKMFLAALGVSMLSVAFLVLCCGTVCRIVLNDYIEHSSRRGILHYIFGGTLIGFGMIVSGSCPGTVFVQVGSGILNSLLTCLVGLLDTYFYYLVVHDRISKEKYPPSSLLLRRVCDLFHIHSVIVHTIFGLVLLGIAIGLEFVVPWKSDLNTSLITKGTVNPNEAMSYIFGMAAWPPSACGAGVGLLQLFFIFFLEKSLGASSAFTVVAAQLCRIKLVGQAFPSLRSFAYGVKNYVTLPFALGAIGGSVLSSCLSRTFPLGPENGTNALSSILGGFLLLLGARCAGGCTSGQGISGTTHLLLGSFLTTAALFGEAILFAFSYSMTTNEWLFQNL